jgi:hypothetical protein
MFIARVLVNYPPDMVCSCVPPKFIAWAAEWALKDYPDASKHLEHYLHGGGADYVEDIPRMMREDEGGRQAIEYEIDRVRKPKATLTDPISQINWSTKNWNYSLGNVDSFSYEVLQDPASKAANASAGDGTAAVKLAILDPYEWHPDEIREVPCLHTGMERMKAAGAADYFSIGEGVVRLKVPKSLIPLP